jgi:hypothetical protein
MSENVKGYKINKTEVKAAGENSRDRDHAARHALVGVAAPQLARTRPGQLVSENGANSDNLQLALTQCAPEASPASAPAVGQADPNVWLVIAGSYALIILGLIFVWLIFRPVKKSD